MNRSKIEWCDYTWNPVTGCLGPKGDRVRCSYCYAHRLAKGRLREKYLRHPLIGAWGAGDPEDPFAPRWAGGLLDPMGKKASRIFVCSMGDLFGGWMPAEWIERILATVRCCPQHTFMFLTKWPQNLAQFNPWPDNCWVGATATTSAETERALDWLDIVQAPVRFISFEPLSEEIVLGLSVLDWGIIGQQTNPDRPPIPSWVQGLIDCLDRANAAVFLKDNLHWPEKRQEWPR